MPSSKLQGSKLIVVFCSFEIAGLEVPDDNNTYPPDVLISTFLWLILVADDLPPPSIADGKIDAGGPSLYGVFFALYFNRSRPLLHSAFLLNVYTDYDLPTRFPTRAAPNKC
ncbi:hypothetical protein PGTUg99_008898 [Puccinia graminis f. sp. tritici]|uniref:Uncharacterized protein n=1 Tax=Puccinia graminis f. sp. tritici TaxID=56615 RepID=A0A5B0RES4_PUCGR|nr:hypothetical protein PGTUg99_008898 [Puccinia graminis f. sp. tritici]